MHHHHWEGRRTIAPAARRELDRDLGADLDQESRFRNQPRTQSHAKGSGIVPGPVIATGGGPVPDPHTTGAVGGQGLHTTGEGGQGPVPVPHVGGIATIDVVPVPGRGHRTREGGRETERGGDRGIERGRGIGTIAEIDVGHQGDGQRRPAPTALLPKSQRVLVRRTVVLVEVLRRVGTPPRAPQRRRRDTTTINVGLPLPRPPRLHNPVEMNTRETATGEATVPAQQSSHRPRPLDKTTVMVGVAVEGMGRIWTRGVARKVTGAPAEAPRRLIVIQVMTELVC